jgi:hypothetical protein
MASFLWKIGGFGVVGSATVAINNANDFPVKDIDVRCEFSGKSGTQLSTSQKTISTLFPPRRNERSKTSTMGLIHFQSAKANCRVETAKRV